MLFSSFLFSQGINITIKDEKGEPIKNAKAFFYEEGTESYIEFSLIRNGTVLFTPKSEYQSLRIKIVSEGFLPEEKVIDDFKISKSYEFSFQLKKDKEYAIEEVVISKRKPITIKKDTVTYNVERFADGTETKLEDILKKLPGIEVDDINGSIKYKGKSIETITLDGDNLFDSNYTIGSKNINFDMIDKVEAVDNYQSNPLLVNANRGDKVSLNVKLKKSILNVSGSVSYGNGYFGNRKEAYDFGGNIITLYNKLKSFSSIQYNNLGLSGNNDFTAKDTDLKYNKTIDDIRTTASLPTSRWNFNNNFIGSLNLIYKHNNSTSFKFNYYINNDKVSMNEQTKNSYQTDNVNFENNSSTNITKSLLMNYFSGELNYLPSKKIRVNSIFVLDHTQDFRDGFYRFNDQGNIRNLSFKQLYFKNTTNITKVFKNEDVLDFFFKLSSFRGNDNQEFLPNLEAGGLHSLQNVEAEKKVLSSYFNYHKKIKKINIIQSLGFKGYDVNLESFLTENTGFNNEKNNILYTDRSFFANTHLKYNYQKWIFESKLNLEQKTFGYNNQSENWTNNNFLLGNESNISYLFGGIDVLSANFEYQKRPILENYLYHNYIRTSYNSVQKNLITRDLQTSKSVGLKFWHNDFENQFLINTFLNYNNEKGQYFSNLNMDSDLISAVYFFSPRENNQFTHFFNLTKLIFPIKTKVKIKTFYARSSYFNIINSEDRKVQVQNFNITLGLNSAFSSKIRFENETTFGFLDYKSDVETKNRSIQNKFTFVLIPITNLSFISEFYTYVPNRNQKSTFNFLDITIKYLPIKTKYSFSFSLRNLLNEKSFVNTFTTDYSQIIQAIPLLPFHFSFGGSYRF
ncbi:TonB-dependent receptor [Chryseobacterium sp. Tr-659]|uniref:TonB-dependent receptor n=1 Tax=Chryseobacterium sp. Tr-659 TaxID=2608340 RepID=UPI001420B6B4|nr:TonB-dependent receptor [Chryseobacterium sp. Tr-659]NIF05307.1 TonB-dependent receptor [Chryseobacterium sp. Tr-659]